VGCVSVRVRKRGYAWSLSQILIGYIAICAVRKGHHLTCPQANGESKVEHSPHIEDATKGTCYEGERERKITKLS